MPRRLEWARPKATPPARPASEPTPLDPEPHVAQAPRHVPELGRGPPVAFGHASAPGTWACQLGRHGARHRTHNDSPLRALVGGAEVPSGNALIWYAGLHEAAHPGPHGNPAASWRRKAIDPAGARCHTCHCGLSREPVVWRHKILREGRSLIKSARPYGRAVMPTDNVTEPEKRV